MKKQFLGLNQAINFQMLKNIELLAQILKLLQHSTKQLNPILIPYMSKNKGPQLLKGVTITIDRGKSKNCTLCQSEFGIFNTEHQCKRCKRPVCDKCSPYKAVALQYKNQKPHRQCNFCKDESEQILKFVNDNQLMFLKDTLSREWLHTFNLTIEDSKRDYQLAEQEAKSVKDQSEYNIFQGQKKNIFAELDLASNYSMREFYELVIRGNELELVYKAVADVLDVFYRKFPNVGFYADLVVITMFLMCFSSQASTYTLLTVIYGNVIPSYLYHRSMRLQPYDFDYEIDSVVSINKMIKRQVVVPFLKNRLNRYILNLSLNFFLFETSFLIINEILSSNEKGFERFLKCIAVSLNLNENEYDRYSYNADQVEVFLLRSTRATKISSQLVLTKNISLEDYSTRETVNKIVTRSLTQAQANESKATQQEQLLRLQIGELKALNEEQLNFIEQLKAQITHKKVREDELKTQLEETKELYRTEKEQRQRFQEENINLRHQMGEDGGQGPLISSGFVESVAIPPDQQQILESVSKLQESMDQVSREKEEYYKLFNESQVILEQQRVSFEGNLAQREQMIAQLQQKLELDVVTPRSGQRENARFAEVLMGKNQEIQELSQNNQEKALQISHLQQQLTDTQMSLEVLESKLQEKETLLYDQTSRIESVNELQRQFTTLKASSDKREGELQKKQQDYDEMRMLLLSKNDEIKEQKILIVQYQGENESLQKSLAEGIKNIAYLEDEIKANKYAINAYGTQETPDQQLEQDIVYLSKDLDQVKRRILLNLQDTIISQQRNIRLKTVENLMKKDERQLEKEASDKKIADLQSELQYVKEDLDDKTHELSQLYKAMGSKVKQSPTRKGRPSNPNTEISSNMSGTRLSLTERPIQDRKKLLDEKEVLDENKSGCSRGGDCQIF